MAAVSWDYSFLSCFVGYPGRNCDQTVYNASAFKREFAIHRPRPGGLTGINSAVPFTSLGDEAFGLTDAMITPYSKAALSNCDDNERLARSIFNVRLAWYVTR